MNKPNNKAARANKSNSPAKVSKASKSKNSTFDFINKIPSMLDEELDNIIVTFHHHGGGSKRMVCNREFFYGEKGRRRLNASQIFQNLNSLKWDFHAKYFVIGN